MAISATIVNIDPRNIPRTIVAKDLHPGEQPLLEAAFGATG
jgi:hypothetical protein